MFIDFSQKKTKIINEINQIFHNKNKIYWCKVILNFLNNWYNCNKKKIFIHTSGTINGSKRKFFTKESMIKSAMLTYNYFNFNNKINALLCLSPNYIAGAMMIIRSIVLKWKLFIIKPSIKPFLSVNRNFDFISMIPIQVVNNLNFLNKKVKILLIGGSPISQKLENKLKYLQTKCYLSYGMTETLSHVAIRKLNYKNHETCFKSLPGVYLNTDARNCLNIFIPSIFNKKIQTNDLVLLKKYYNFYKFLLLGRIDNIIKIRNCEIIPEQLEQKLSFYIEQSFFIFKKNSKQIILIIEGSCKRLIIPENIFINKINFLDLKKIYFLPSFIRTKTHKIDRKKTFKLINFK